MEPDEIREKINEISTKEIEWVFDRYNHLLAAREHRQYLLEQVEGGDKLIEEALKVLRSE